MVFHKIAEVNFWNNWIRCRIRKTIGKTFGMCANAGHAVERVVYDEQTQLVEAKRFDYVRGTIVER